MHKSIHLLVLGSYFIASLALGAEPDPRSVPLASENPKYLQVDLPVDERVADLIERMTLEEKAIALNHNGPDLERFGLRSDKWNQCLNGVQWDSPTTLFPCCVALAATWDPDFIEHQAARVLSDEARAIYNLWHEDPETRFQHKGLGSATARVSSWTRMQWATTSSFTSTSLRLGHTP